MQAGRVWMIAAGNVTEAACTPRIQRPCERECRKKQKGSSCLDAWRATAMPHSVSRGYRRFEMGASTCTHQAQEDEPVRATCEPSPAESGAHDEDAD